MNHSTNVGISDLRLYVPEPHMPVERLIRKRSEENPKLERHLERAVKTTGQRSIRFPASWEDTATMAAEAAASIFDHNYHLSRKDLRYLVTGTETGLDHSKPLSAYVSGMLTAAGYDIPRSMTSYQVQHACAGATLGLVSVGSMIGMRNNAKDAGIVIASDIARYSPATTAEVTQGAGAAAVLVENNPALLSLDFANAGYASFDTDDFFRPIGSKVAQVKGRYSMECYVEALNEAFEDHANQRGEHAGAIIEESDMFVLHTPFRNMPEIAMKDLLSRHMGLEHDESDDFLKQKGFHAGIDAVAHVGNTYSASLYIALAATLADRYKTYGKGIIGERVTLASYGSGNTMIVLTGVVAERAAEVIESWDIDSILRSAVDTSFEEYESWLNSPYIQNPAESIAPAVPEGGFFLDSIRADGYREYGVMSADTFYELEEPENNEIKERIAVVA